MEVNPMSKKLERGICPLVDREITAQDCTPVVAVVSGAAPLYEIPREFRQKSGWQDICKACEYRPKNQAKEKPTTE